MGGKQSNLWQMDIGESGATDHKHRTPGEEIRDEAHQQLSEQQAKTEGSFIPKTGENPALTEIRARREQSEEAREEERTGDQTGEEQ